MRVLRAYTLCLLLLLAAPLFAQQSAPTPVPVAPLEPSQLPARTLFYLIWRGVPTGDIRHANALMNLWDDPDSAPLRNSLVQSVLSDTKKQKDKPALTRDELTEFAALLDNPFVLGYLPRPAGLPAPKPAATPSTPAKPGTSPTMGQGEAAKALDWNGLFFVYDRTGKEAILSKAVLRMRSASADSNDIPKLTNITVAGVPSLKIERKASVTYYAENGKYVVSASDPAVFEEVLNRLGGKSKDDSLVSLAAYQEAKPLLGVGIMEFFLRVPGTTDMAVDSATSNPQMKAMLKAFKFDAFHSAAGHLSLEGAKTRFQGALLGDTAAGSLFDIWSDGEANPAAFVFLSVDTVSLTEYEINFPGIYKVLKQAFTQGPNSSPQMVTALESAAQTRLGMSIPDALALTTGEITSLQNSPILDDALQIRILGIQNKPDSMKLLRTVMGEKITSERNEGATTFMKISLGGAQGANGVAQWNFYHLAMTPDFLLGASKPEPLRALLGDASTTTAVAVLPKNIVAARSQFPEKLNGFSYIDFQKIDWPGLKEKSIADAKAAAAKAKPGDATAAATKNLSDWLTNANPAVFPRHLHTLTGASWKDAKGIHLDEWLD